MRRRIIASTGALALAAMLLVNFRGPEDLTLSATATSSGPDPNRVTGGSGARTGAGIGTTGTTGTTGTIGIGTGATGASRSAQATTGPAAQFVGPPAADPYGDVQVQITIQDGKIVDLVALAMPVGGHSGRISSYVAPILRTQALTAQSANIDGVSGATYTSRAYAQSLQGALDQAGL